MSGSAVEPRRVSLAEEAGLLGSVHSSADMAESIARRAYEADSLDALVEVEESIEAGLPALEDMLYTPLIFFGMEALPSKYESNEVFGVFQVAKAKPAPGSKSKTQCDWVADGDTFLVSCGARNVVFGIAGCIRRDELPAAFVIVTKKTGAGYDAFWPRPISAKYELPAKPRGLAQSVAQRQSERASEAPFSD